MFEKHNIIVVEFEDQWGWPYIVAIDTTTGAVIKAEPPNSASEILEVLYEMRRIIRRNQAITPPEARRAAEAACNWKADVRKQQRWNEQDLPGMFQGRIVEMKKRRDCGDREWYWDAFPKAFRHFQKKEWGA